MSLRKQLISPRSPIQSEILPQSACQSRSPTISPYSSFHDSSSPSDGVSPRSISSPSTSKAMLDKELMNLPHLSIEEVHLKIKKLQTIYHSKYYLLLEYKLQAILNLAQALERAALKIRREQKAPSKSSCLPTFWQRNNKIFSESKLSANQRLHFNVQDAYSLEEEFSDNVKLLIIDTQMKIEVSAVPINKEVYNDTLSTFKNQFERNLEEGFFKQLKLAERDEVCLFSQFVRRVRDILDADIKLKKIPHLLRKKKPCRPSEDFLSPPQRLSP